jgi:dienelactone hydrolase
MKKYIFKILIFTFIVFSLQKLPAQRYAVMDTVYTPPDFEIGPLTATICIPAIPNGIGVVIAHGGYGIPCQRQSMKIWCDTLAAIGYLAMTIDYYSLDAVEAPYIDTSAAYPRQVTTFKIAVEFLRRNADRFQITTGKIVGFGMSGGAYHWGQSITWDNDDIFFQTDSTIADSLDAVILLYGLYDNYNFLSSWLLQVMEEHFALYPDLRATKGNPIANVANITTPVLIIHGTADQNVSYQQSVQLHDSLIALGKNSQLVLFPGLAHGFELTSFFPPHQFTEAGLVVIDTMLSFLRHTFGLPPDFIKNQEHIVARYSLYQNYPNPFNPSTVISYQLRSNSFATLTVYDILGKKIATLVSERQPAGMHKVNFNASNLSGGIYFYCLKAGNFLETKKMIILK